MSAIASDGTALTTREAILRQVARISIQPALAGRFPVPLSRLMIELATRTVPVHRHTQVRRGHLAGIPVEVVRPAKGGTDGSLLLYAHGGGFALGSPRTHRPLTAALAHAMGATVVFPDYRLAPEDPFPAAVDDVAAVYRTLSSATRSG